MNPEDRLPSHPSARVRARVPALVRVGGVAAVVAAAAMIGLAAPAAAEAPFRLPASITDHSGVGADGSAGLKKALRDIQANDNIQMWVVFVPNFDGMTGEKWAQRTHGLSGMQKSGIVFAIATDAREYGHYSSDSDARKRAEAAAKAFEKHMAGGGDDFLGGAVAAAEAAENHGELSGGSVAGLVGTGAVAAGGIGGAVYWGRRRRAQRTAAQVVSAQSIDPTDIRAISSLPIDVLDARAREELISTDELIRSSEEQLDLAVAEFGTAQAAPFVKALEASRTTLARAFEIRQRLDDSIPETPVERRAMLTDIVSSCGQADAELARRAQDFAEMRNLLVNAPLTLDGVTRRIVELTTRVPAAEARLADLRSRYSETALSTVADNVEIARAQLAAAEQASDSAREMLARPAGDQGPMIEQIHAAEASVAQADKLLAGIEHAEDNIRQANASLDDLLAETRREIGEARELAATGDAEKVSFDVPALRAAAQRADDAILEAESVRASDPLRAYTGLSEADAALDAILDTARVRTAEHRRDRAAVEVAVGTATAHVSAAKDFIDTRGAIIGSTARTRLAEATRHLQSARSLAESTPIPAAEEAAQATSLAKSALHSAQSDVDRHTRNMNQHGGGGGTGAMIGGIIIGSMLSGGFGGFGGGGSGGGGFSGGGGGGGGGGGRF